MRQPEKKIAAHTRATTLVRDTLIVEVEDIVWQRQLSTLRHFLLRNLHGILGEPLVREIDFRPMPARRPPELAAAARSFTIDEGGGIEDPVMALIHRQSLAAGAKENRLRITEQEVKRVAELANLALSEHEIAKMTQDMSGILTYIDKLNELDTSNVAPMAQVLFEQEETATLRADEECPTLSNTDALANAPSAGLGYFKVPKVIER